MKELARLLWCRSGLRFGALVRRRPASFLLAAAGRSPGPS